MIPQRAATERLPPGPELSASEQVRRWINQPIEFWESCAREFGDVFTVNLGSLGTTVVFRHVDAVREIFRLPPHVYTVREYNEHYRLMMGDHSLLLLDGDCHQRVRKKLTAFFQREQLCQHVDVFAAFTREMVHDWPLGVPFSVQRSLHELTLRIMLHLLFGRSGTATQQQLLHLFRSQILQDSGAWSSWTRLVHLHEPIRRLIADEVARRRHRNQFHPDELLDALALPLPADTEPLSEAAIQDQVLTLLVAGVDPTAISLSWAMYWVLNTPAVYGEVRRAFEHVNASTHAAELLELPYLQAVCQETTRMVPVVTTPSGRKLVHDFPVAGWLLPGGTTLLPCTYLVHRDPRWYDQPNEFIPARFLVRRYTPFEYFPYGGGSRYCLGAALAQVELPLVLGTVFRGYDLESANVSLVKPVRYGTLLAPSENLIVRRRA